MRLFPITVIASFGSISACADTSPPTSSVLCGTAPCDALSPGDATISDVVGDAMRPTFDAPTPRPTDLVSIEIVPQNPVLSAIDGQMPTQTFTVRGRQRNGTMIDVTRFLRFSLDASALGSINADTGVFTANGIGGTVTVRVSTVDGSAVSAQTTITINARTTTLVEVTAEERAAFDRTPATGSPGEQPLVDYPLARAVMPQNAPSPLIQWTLRHREQPNYEIWRVRLARPHAVIEGYFRSNPDFPMAWRPSADAWRTLAQADLTAPITLTVSVRLRDNTVRESEARIFRTIDAVIAGSVYYWSPDRASLQRVDVDQARRVDFLPNPGDGCIGCHAVSRDGQHLIGYLEGSRDSIALYDLSRDLTGSPAPTVARVTSAHRRCTSFNPTATRIVSGDCDTDPSGEGFTLLDGRTANPVTTMGSPGNGFDPEWSPDGASIAYTTRTNDLALTPALPNDTFGSPIVLHNASASNIDWHPTWSPDSRWLLFQRGTLRRTGMGPGSLWMISRTGGTPVALTNANNGTENESYRPVFSPFNSGGYFWALFTTSRPYGNTRSGVRDRKQIWIAAVSNRPNGTSDPSEVAYYMDGQERVTCLSPYWTPAPCRRNGTQCTTSDDCCSGTCEPDSNNNRVCMPPRGGCIARGGRCGGETDCCAGLVCTNGRICDIPSPQ
jgi:hypothetical protein